VALTQGLMRQKGGGHYYQLLLFLMSVRMRDVAELKVVSFWKPDKILPPSVLLACKQVELTECILSSLWSS